MNYILNSPPGTYEHRARECKVCGVDQAAFYRAYKSDDPLRCTVCGTIEGSVREAQASTPNIAVALVRELEAATEQRGGVVARVDGSDLHAEAAELRAEVDRLAGELVAQQERVRALCEAIDEAAVGACFWADSNGPYTKIYNQWWNAIVAAREALRTVGKEAGGVCGKPLAHGSLSCVRLAGHGGDCDYEMCAKPSCYGSECAARCELPAGHAGAHDWEAAAPKNACKACSEKQCKCPTCCDCGAVRERAAPKVERAHDELPPGWKRVEGGIHPRVERAYYWRDDGEVVVELMRDRGWYEYRPAGGPYSPARIDALHEAMRRARGLATIDELWTAPPAKEPTP